jgi:hypothetical protein
MLSLATTLISAPADAQWRGRGGASVFTQGLVVASGQALVSIPDSASTLDLASADRAVSATGGSRAPCSAARHSVPLSRRRSGRRRRRSTMRRHQAGTRHSKAGTALRKGTRHRKATLHRRVTHPRRATHLLRRVTRRATTNPKLNSGRRRSNSRRRWADGRASRAAGRC